MAAYGFGIDLPFLAGEDLNAEEDRYCVVGISTSQGKVIKATKASGSGGAAFGVVQNNPSSGQEATVRVWGMSKALVDASSSPISYGQFLSPVASAPHKLEAHPPTKAGSPFAIALGSLSSGSGRIEVFIFGGNLMAE